MSRWRGSDLFSNQADNCQTFFTSFIRSYSKFVVQHFSCLILIINKFFKNSDQSFLNKNFIFKVFLKENASLRKIDILNLKKFNKINQKSLNYKVKLKSICMTK